jgi:hypothetical protein
VLAEGAAGDERDAHGLEVAGHGKRNRFTRLVSLGNRAPLDTERNAGIVVGHRQRPSRRCGPDAG